MSGSVEEQRLRALARYALNPDLDRMDMLELMKKAAEIGASGHADDCCRAQQNGAGSQQRAETGSGCQSENLQEVERETILRVFKESGRNVMKASQRLGISTVTLYTRLRNYGVAIERES